MDETPPLPSISGYRIRGVLGRGGMGTVYDAEQENPRRNVALKVLHGGPLVDPETLALFRREVRALARLAHPGVAALYASGTTPDGIHFFAMERVDGSPLDAWRAGRSGSGPIPNAEIEARVAVFLQVCDAVAYAHGRGVIHRDLKPSNIVVRESEGSVELKVLDFGLARITASDEAARSRITEHGILRGTVPYMSPEQLTGDPDAVDARSDVYALGVLLYELLTGSHPLDADRVSTFELPAKILNDPPIPISRSWKGKRKIDTDLGTIVMKCLEKEPARRYATVQGLADDLRRWRSRQPIAARPPSTAYQIRKMIRRNRLAFVALVVGALVVTGSAVAMAILARHLANERDRANREAEAARSNAAAFSRILMQRVPGTGFKRLDDPEAVSAMVGEILRNWASDPQGAIEMLRAAGQSVFENGAYAGGIRLVEEAHAIECRTLADPHGTGIAQTLGEMYQRVGRHAEALALFEGDVESARANARDPRALGYALENLGCALRDLGRFDEAEAALKEAQRQYAIDPIPVPWLVSSVHNSLGNLYLARGDLAVAEVEHRRAVEFAGGSWTAPHPQALKARHDLAVVLLRRGKLDEAGALLRRVFDEREALLGHDHPDTAASLAAWGDYENASGRSAAARAAYERAAVIVAAKLPPDHPLARELRAKLDAAR